jgi:hypothetical protein
MLTKRIGEWKNVGVITIPKATTEEQLAVALLDMLNYFALGERHTEPVKQACKILGHPDDGGGKCYCREGNWGKKGL